MGRLTDTHCHLNLPIFQEDLEEILEKAWGNGLARILVPGVNLETSRAAVALAEKHPNLYASVGVHPGDATTWKEDTLVVLRDLAQHPKVVAIGEIGLDYYRDRSPRPLQREVFRTQLELAGKFGLPVVVHNRDSIDDLWATLAAWQAELRRAGSPLAGTPGVLHSFDGSSVDAQKAAEAGFYIGISGPVTYKNAPERQITAAGLAVEHILIETDAPYLTPHPYRGKRNEPAFVTLVAEKVSELHEINLETVVQATWKNAARLFHWGADF